MAGYHFFKFILSSKEEHLFSSSKCKCVLNGNTAGSLVGEPQLVSHSPNRLLRQKLWPNISLYRKNNKNSCTQKITRACMLANIRGYWPIVTSFPIMQIPCKYMCISTVCAFEVCRKAPPCYQRNKCTAQLPRSKCKICHFLKKKV